MIETAQPVRCDWAEGSAAERDYHDCEWGVPLHGDDALFELLCLEGAQAGLSWRTVLNRRAHYRAAFHGFAIPRVARMTDAALERVLEQGGVIRHRAKVFGVRVNAQAAERIAGGLDAFVWSFVDGKPVRNAWTARDQVPAVTPASERMSRALRKLGFVFVGPTICYAFMQASGMVNDHLVSCFRYEAV
ncbi:MAG TPA: DNA-3-methyladenine glycosylase I [Acetobacteraceae bacterium]|nr:DNA-3-methyladenine glycosylase I [Acetobacteraceae bacterium]